MQLLLSHYLEGRRVPVAHEVADEASSFETDFGRGRRRTGRPHDGGVVAHGSPNDTDVAVVEATRMGV